MKSGVCIYSSNIIFIKIVIYIHQIKKKIQISHLIVPINLQININIKFNSLKYKNNKNADIQP